MGQAVFLLTLPVWPKFGYSRSAMLRDRLAAVFGFLIRYDANLIRFPIAAIVYATLESWTKN